MPLEEKTLLERELTSDIFYNIVGKAIKETQNTGYETGFGILKHISEDKIIYTLKLTVGDCESLSVGVGLSRAREKYLDKLNKNSKKKKIKLFKSFER